MKLVLILDDIYYELWNTLGIFELLSLQLDALSIEGRVAYSATLYMNGQFKRLRETIDSLHSWL